MDIGIRELKAKLSEYLDRVQRGEIIRVTDRGRPKVLIVPVNNPLLEQRIQRGIAEGWITPPRSDAPPARFAPVRADRSIQEMMDEDRGE